MRLFVAVELGEEVLERAVALVADLKGRAERSARGARLTWATRERMHLTLRFVGYVQDERAGDILHALREPMPVAPFVVAWEGLGSFPPRGAPRVLWIGAAAGRNGLLELERVVSDRLQALGIPPEGRPYNPHLTLARVREPAGLRMQDLLRGAGDVRLGATHVQAITLFESRLSPTGPTYIALQRTPLER